MFGPVLAVHVNRDVIFVLFVYICLVGIGSNRRLQRNGTVVVDLETLICLSRPHPSLVNGLTWEHLHVVRCKTVLIRTGYR
jgi:hypothetical protein